MPGQWAVAGRASLPYTDPVRFRLGAFWASALVLAASSASARADKRYVQLETSDAFVYMDGEGVAVRVEKNWACRNVGWASTAEPTIYGKEGFTRFWDIQIANGTDFQWNCTIIAGPVVYSREVQRAQREMNASPKRPAQARRIPETGRYNWEMLDYTRLVLSAEIREARRIYEGQVIAAYLDFLSAVVAEERIQRDPDAVIAELSAKGMARRLDIQDPHCGRIVATVHDAVTCRLADRETRLLAAEDSYKDYADIVNGLDGHSAISAGEAQAVNLAARQVQRRLARFEAAALGLTGPEGDSSR